MSTDHQPQGTAAAIIVHYGDASATMRLVHLLSEADTIDRVVVVANDARPAPPSLPGKTTWLIPGSNLGYAGAFVYAREAIDPHKVYICLNNDLEIDSAAIASCLRALTTKRVGAVTPTLVSKKGSELVSGGYWSRHLQMPRGLNSRYARRHSSQLRHRTDVDWICGAAMFLDSEALKVSGFDRTYFLGFEDCDLSDRLRRAGYTLVVDSSRAVHSAGASMGSTMWAYYYLRNAVWFARRRRGAAVAAAAWIRYLLSGMAHAVCRPGQRWRMVCNTAVAACHAFFPMPDCELGGVGKTSSRNQRGLREPLAPFP